MTASSAAMKFRSFPLINAAVLVGLLLLIALSQLVSEKNITAEDLMSGGDRTLQLIANPEYTWECLEEYSEHCNVQ